MGLKKSISVRKGVILAVSMVIGSGLFGLPGLTLEKGSVYEVIAGWGITVVAVIPLIYIFAKLGSSYPSAAGIAKYAQESFGERGRYAATYILIGTFIIGLPGIAIIGGECISRVTGGSGEAVYIYALLILIAATVQNLLPHKWSIVINSGAVFILALILAGVILLNRDNIADGMALLGGVNSGNISVKNLWSVSALIFWAFLGWENLSFGLEEFKNPEKNIPKVYLGSFLIVTVFYLLLAFATVGAKSNGLEIAGASGITVLFHGTFFAKWIIIAMIAVIVANCGSWAFGASRLLFSAGREGIVWRKTGETDKNGIPFCSLAMLFLIYIAVLYLSYFYKIGVDILMMLVNQNFIILYIMTVAAYYKVESRAVKNLIIGAAVFSMLFFISGFTYMMVYPVVLGIAGITVFNRYISKNRAVQPAEKNQEK